MSDDLIVPESYELVIPSHPPPLHPFVSFPTWHISLEFFPQTSFYLLSLLVNIEVERERDYTSVLHGNGLHMDVDLLGSYDAACITLPFRACTSSIHLYHFFKFKNEQQ